MFLALIVGACTSSSSGDATHGSSSASATPRPGPTASLISDRGNASFAYGNFVTFTSKGFHPKTLLAPLGTPIVWRNATHDPVVVQFDNYGSPVNSGPIPPGGTWSFEPSAQLSIAYHAAWQGTRFAAFVQTQLVGNSGA